MTERELFEAALDLPPTDRASFLRLACGTDAAMRRRIEALLANVGPAERFLEQPLATDAFQSKSGGSAPPDEPLLAGRYKLLEEIGEGGMGSVWMARQTEPVKRLVAVKLIKPGMDSKQVLARFEAERQALALMDHPNIAKVHDGGAAPDGRPFFVMELVKGIPLTRFCDEHHLTPRQRLELFIPVCQAIQHAHQKGVIHRDLKPSNVLVALYDDRPVPKVIDFGIAKATGQALTERTLHTGFGSVVGTVEYMSPEQASFNQLDVDTRSDIYSLGVLLYELLAGTPPFTAKELETNGILEVLRIIREQEPPKPSTKLSTAEGLPALASQRGTEPKKLAALVRGELDWIVMKALEKDRSRRYESATHLAADLHRHLAGDPVLAAPPSPWYRLRKLLRRNALMVAALTTVFVALTAGMVAATVGLYVADEARQQEGVERRRAETALAKEADQRREVEHQLAGQMVDRVAEENATVSEREALARLAALLPQLPESARVMREFLSLRILIQGQRLAPLLPDYAPNHPLSWHLTPGGPIAVAGPWMNARGKTAVAADAAYWLRVDPQTGAVVE